MRSGKKRPNDTKPRGWGWAACAILTVPAAAQLETGAARSLGARERAPDPVPAPTIVRVNTSSAGVQANGPTDVSAVSADGRFVAFSSVATNLVLGDPAGIRDVFVCDTLTGFTSLVSVSLTGQPGNGPSGTEIAISADGRFVAFDSWASDLVAGDTNGLLDIFVHDRLTGVTQRISVDSAGTEANGVSAGVSMSADARYLAFSSWATNLVPSDMNGVQDIFLHDRLTGATLRVTETPQGIGGEGVSHSPFLSSNGLFVAYVSRANNLVPGPLSIYHYVFVYDVGTGETWHASVNSLGEFAHADSDSPSISTDGRFVAFSTPAYNLAFPDLNGVSDVFVHDHATGLTTRVSVSSSGLEGNGGSVLPSLSVDGNLVAFVSGADNLVPGDNNVVQDVFLHDRSRGTLSRISRASIGIANGPSTTPSLASEGTTLVFGSDASNLITGDTNLVRDVFLCPLP